MWLIAISGLGTCVQAEQSISHTTVKLTTILCGLSVPKLLKSFSFKIFSLSWMNTSVKFNKNQLLEK